MMLMRAGGWEWVFWGQGRALHVCENYLFLTPENQWVGISLWLN